MDITKEAHRHLCKNQIQLLLIPPICVVKLKLSKIYCDDILNGNLARRYIRLFFWIKPKTEAAFFLLLHHNFSQRSFLLAPLYFALHKNSKFLPSTFWVRSKSGWFVSKCLTQITTEPGKPGHQHLC